jgi:AhpD family alkylhydroperoxidase
MTTTFLDHTAETAPEAVRPALRGTIAKLGFLPSAMARMAESPAVVGAFGRALATWEACSLTHLQREVVTLTIAHEVGCEVCVAMHSSLVDRTIGDAPLLAALRAQTPLVDGRLETLRTFTLAVLREKGAVEPATLEGFLEAGFTREQALDVVLGVATYTLSTFANRLTRAPLDAELAAYAWERVTG